MKPLGTQEAEIERWTYMDEVVGYKDDIVPKDQNFKNSQFAQPLFEFSGACAGCGETPYLKAITQLFGERMLIANATGCSSIYGGSAPAAPYCKNNKSGKGPAWANSLFEDNAEYGFGMRIAQKTIRDRMQNIIVNQNEKFKGKLKDLLNEWVENRYDGDKTLELADKIIPLLEKENFEAAKDLLEVKDYFVKQSNWIIGGDGWAYDIGYGGLDHVIANEEDVNILVLDTEVYSNTGGQSSKASRAASIAKFTAAGKPNKKKDLAALAMSYEHVYVAMVSHGANPTQLLKAMKEAENYPGPSIIIAYSPCIAHGIDMRKSVHEEKLAVQSGYWPLYRYDPRKEEPLQLDSAKPNIPFSDYIGNEIRYKSLEIQFPDQAKDLFEKAEKDASFRRKEYMREAGKEEKDTN